MKKNLVLREKVEKREIELLDPELASFAVNTQGRVKSEEKCPVRTCFMRDRDRIIHSGSFRRLKDKTQVFTFSSFSHPRTRLTHTFEVAQIARTIARVLRLNEDLVEAIALGHDLGHAPFGHLGEKVIDSRTSFPFHHSHNSLRIVETLEKEGRGLNLTIEVRDGILKHSKSYVGMDNLLSKTPPMTNEAVVVSLSDSIAYLNHDIEDSLNMNIIGLSDFPQKPLETLGLRHAQRIHTMVKGLVEYSSNTGKISMPPDILKAANELRKFMFDNIYRDADQTQGSIEAVNMLNRIWDYYEKNTDDFYKEFNIEEYDDYERMMTDRISALTDNDVRTIYSRLFRS